MKSHGSHIVTVPSGAPRDQLAIGELVCEAASYSNSPPGKRVHATSQEDQRPVQVTTSATNGSERSAGTAAASTVRVGPRGLCTAFMAGASDEALDLETPPLPVSQKELPGTEEPETVSSLRRLL